MSAQIDILLDPWPNLALHSAIFIGTIIIIWFWFSEIPWIPIFAFPTFALFNLLLAIHNKMINGSSNPVDTNPVNTDEGEEDAEGGHEISGGRTIKNPYVTSSATPSTKTTPTHDPNDVPGAKHGGSPTGRTQPMGTTYQATPKNKSPEVTSVEKLAQTQADIKARMSPPAQQANYTGDMGPNADFFPDK
jgi:hypothetical protein